MADPDAQAPASPADDDGPEIATLPDLEAMLDERDRRRDDTVLARLDELARRPPPAPVVVERAASPVVPDQDAVLLRDPTTWRKDRVLLAWVLSMATLMACHGLFGAEPVMRAVWHVWSSVPRLAWAPPPGGTP